MRMNERSGSVFIDFKEADGLHKALDLNGTKFEDSPLRISIAFPPNRKHKRDQQERNPQKSDNQEQESTEDSKKERPKYAITFLKESEQQQDQSSNEGKPKKK